MYNIPYQFILRELYPLRAKIKKRVGGYFVFVEDKMLLFLREGDNQPEFNGVFVATQPEYITALKQEIHNPNLTFDFDGTTDSWLFISADLEDFKVKVSQVCSLIKNRDERVGR